MIIKYRKLEMEYIEESMPILPETFDKNEN